jgi:Fe-S-cluster containining protein
VTAASDPVDMLRSAIAAGVDPLFALARFRAFQNRFHDAYVAAKPVSCLRGCSSCCSQMVFDVSPVEIEDLGQYLRRAGRQEEVAAALRRRRDLYDAIRLESPRDPGESEDDWTERVARAFWAQAEPCALLDAEGGCSVFAHRPQSCRRFFVHGPADLCTPDAADSPDRKALMVEPGSEDEVDRLLLALNRGVRFDPEDDRLDHALLRWIENRSPD